MTNSLAFFFSSQFYENVIFFMWILPAFFIFYTNIIMCLSSLVPSGILLQSLYSRNKNIESLSSLGFQRLTPKESATSESVIQPDFSSAQSMIKSNNTCHTTVAMPTQRMRFYRTDGTCNAKKSILFILPHCYLASVPSHTRHTFESVHNVLFQKGLSIWTHINKIRMQINLSRV